jgi:hypothetical protein
MIGAGQVLEGHARRGRRNVVITGRYVQDFFIYRGFEVMSARLVWPKVQNEYGVFKVMESACFG